MGYEHATDCKGQTILPGDRVSIKLYPRGTVQGTVFVSDRIRIVPIDGGSTVPALMVRDDQGTTYTLPGSKSVRKLMKG